jgi:hypothetical protein
MSQIQQLKGQLHQIASEAAQGAASLGAYKLRFSHSSAQVLALIAAGVCHPSGCRDELYGGCLEISPPAASGSGFERLIRSRSNPPVSARALNGRAGRAGAREPSCRFSPDPIEEVEHPAREQGGRSLVVRRQ